MLGKKIDKIYGIDYNSYLCAGIGNPIKLQLGEITFYSFWRLRFNNE